jgi:hypothetical protein
MISTLRIPGLLLGVILLLAQIPACKKEVKPDEKPNPPTNEAEAIVSMNNIVGVDQFGRSFNVVSSLDSKKQVGLFFWLWIGQPYASGIYDATKILAMPNGLKLLTDIASHNPSVSPNGEAHFWGEPLWGYYNSDDVWVIRKQIEMLTIAGVDFIFFDATNSFIYKNVYERLLRIIDEYQQKGWSPPKVVFYTHSKSFQTIREVYRELYKPGLYSNTWYKVDGKPMIIGYTDPQDDINEAKSRGDNAYVPGLLSAEILNFFHFKRAQWPSDPVYPDGFPWVEWKFPQPMHNGIMNVTVASHPSVPMSFSLTKGFTNWGRGWNPDTKTNNPQDVDEGTFFQRQWDHAITSNPSMITIGGWNEWIAYKQQYWDEYVLVDAANKEYSRDIEPMRGGYEDAFYIQMIKNIRRYKGQNATVQPAKKKTINITAGISQWNDIPSVAVNIHSERFNRNAAGASNGLLYSQPSPANHIRDIKVSHDDKNVYFFIRAKDRFTDNAGKSNWLNILVGTGEPGLKAWESYEYLIGSSFKDGNVSVGKLNEDFTTSNATTARYIQSDNVIQIECPLAALSLQNGNKFYFKVAAGVEQPSEIMSYYTTGVSLPLGRLSYMYAFQK